VAVEGVAAVAADSALPGYRRRIADADATENLDIFEIHLLFISELLNKKAILLEREITPFVM